MTGSRHLKALFKTVARDFMPATADALGSAVAVTYRELIVVRARNFRRPRLQRYRLCDIGDIHHLGGRRVSCLLVDLCGDSPRTIMILYDRRSRAEFQRLIAVLHRLTFRARWRASSYRARSARTAPRPIMMKGTSQSVST